MDHMAHHCSKLPTHNRKYVRTVFVTKLATQQIITMPYKYKRVCQICQRPNVIQLSSHLDMVHRLSATERSPYLKRAVLCPSEAIMRPTVANDKKNWDIL